MVNFRGAGASRFRNPAGLWLLIGFLLAGAAALAHFQVKDHDLITFDVGAGQPQKASPKEVPQDLK